MEWRKEELSIYLSSLFVEREAILFLLSTSSVSLSLSLLKDICLQKFLGLFLQAWLTIPWLPLSFRLIFFYSIYVQ